MKQVAASHPLFRSLALANGGVAIHEISLAVGNARRQGMAGEATSNGTHFFGGEITRANAAENTIVVIHLSSFCDFFWM
jgi:hypothetical protein